MYTSTHSTYVARVLFLCSPKPHHTTLAAPRRTAPPTGGARGQEDRAAELLRCRAHAAGGDDAGLPPERRGVLRHLRGAQEHGPNLLEPDPREVHQVPSGPADPLPN